MRVLAVLLLGCSLVPAQTTAARRLVRAIGEASVTVRPDAARVTVSIVKQGATAAEAASANAIATAAVIDALRQLLGANADIKTVSYHLSPLHNYPRDGSPGQIIGFTASNTIQAVTTDTTQAGRVVDTAIAAGATMVNGVGLFLRDDDAARTQALRQAAVRARAKADAIALGAGVRLGSVLMAQEGMAYALAPSARIEGGPTATAAPTPIEAGTLEVRATVTLDVEITP